jgi:hypothetical protein
MERGWWLVGGAATTKSCLYFQSSKLDGVIWQVFAGIVEAVPVVGLERNRFEMDDPLGLRNTPTLASLGWGTRRTASCCRIDDETGVYGDLSCAIIFEQPVSMSGPEGEAAKQARLLPTGHR